MKAKVFEARIGKIENVPLEKELNQFLAGVKEVHFITQSECAVQSGGSATRHTTVTVLYD